MNNRKLMNKLAAWDKGKKVLWPLYTIVKRKSGEHEWTEVHDYNTVDAQAILGKPKHLRRDK